MSLKAVSIALVAATIALPVPASQLLSGRFSSPAPQAIAAAGPGSLATLIEDPFLVDRMSFAAPKSFLDTSTGVTPSTRG